MEKQSALLLAAPSQEQLVAAISRRLSVAGVIGLGRASWFRSLALPVFADIDSALAQVRPDVVCFLATRGGYINGTVLHVNGGLYGG